MPDVTVTGLDKLIDQFGRIKVTTLPVVDGVVARSAGNIVKGARRRVSGLAHAPAYPASIGFDQFHTPGTSQARIGPDKDKRQGDLGNILNYGTIKNAPIPHLDPALTDEIVPFSAALEEAAAKMWDEP